MLNSGRYIESTMKPTMPPTNMIMIGSMLGPAPQMSG
jgi:hypothetical protein